MRSNILVFILLMCTTSISWGLWHVTTLYDDGITPSLALNGEGLPGIAYYRVDNGARYAWYNGSTWQSEYIFQPSYGNGGWLDLLYDENDLPHVSLGGLSYTGIAYAFRSGSWDVSFLPEHGTWTSIAMDPQGTPCFAVLNFSRDNCFIHWNGSGWESQLIESGNDYWGSISLDTDSGGSAHIAYNSGTCALSVKYALRDPSGDIVIETVDSAMTTEPRGISLAIYDGLPAVSYNVGGEVRYAFNDGDSWSVETVYSVDTGAGVYGTSLAHDSFGNPHIAHCSGENGDLLYSFNTGTGWVTETVHPISYLGDPSLALDSENRPHIAFIGAGTAVMYAVGSSMGTEETSGSMPAIAISANPFSGSLSITFQAGGNHAELSVYDCSGRRVATVFSGSPAAGGNTATWTPDPALPAGGYILALRSRGDLQVQRVAYLKQ